MKDNSVNRVMLLAVFIVFAIAMVFITYYITVYNNGTDKYFKNYNRIVKNELSEVLKRQEEINDEIKEISQNGNYTFDSPYIMENPYGLNPLTALIIFNTNENRSVNVKINDMQMTKVESSKNHIIPIYGLYANSTNFIELELDNGTTKVIEIATTSYNDDIEGIVFAKENKDNTHKFLLGNLKSSNSYLRGFDNYNKLIYYMDFGYIGGIRYNIDKVYVGYNLIYSKNTELQDLNLEIDNMGRILSISTDTSELNYSYSIENGDKVYSYMYKNLYESQISNYKITDMIDNEPYTLAGKYKTEELEEDLVNVELYQEEYLISFNGEYITFEFDNNEDKELLLVTKNTDYSYLYNLSDRNIIKSDAFGDWSLYLKIDDKYYTLLTTVDN